MYDVIVVGGGAAGMMAARTARSRGRRVLLIERNKRLGEKLRITGGGRCNILNAETDEKKLLSHYGSSEQALYSAFAQFGMSEATEFFESHGLPLTVQAKQRAFPKSENAEEVARFFEQELAAAGVEVLKGTKVSEILTKDSRVTGVRAGGKEYSANAIVLATGGVSHPETGSTGDGFGWLRTLGLTVHEPTPTIVPVKVKEQWVKKLSGTTLTDIKISFFIGSEKKFSKKGNILLTHFGLSGPLILNSAGRIADLLHEGVVSAYIDTYPGMDLGILDAHFTRVFDQHKNKQLKNVFREIAPVGTADVLLSLLPDVDPEQKVHSVTKETRRLLAEHLKELSVTITELMGFDRAVVADGGLTLADIDTKTMRTKKYENLYVTGDLLHITRPSGGYSLQLCWTTGSVAGMHA